MAPSPSPSKVACSPECGGPAASRVRPQPTPSKKCPKCCQKSLKDFILCGWCRRKTNICRNCQKCCKPGWKCRKFKRKCKYYLLCRCCYCCYPFTDKDYDKAFLDKPVRKRLTSKSPPRIIRREEDVKYVRRPRHRIDTLMKQSENETEVYFCTIKLDSLSTKRARQPLSTLSPHRSDLPAVHTATGI